MSIIVGRISTIQIISYCFGGFFVVVDGGGQAFLLCETEAW